MTNNELDRAVEIEQLAGLDPLDYEATRTSASDRLGLRAHVLDKAVAKKRRALGLDDNETEPGQGRAAKIVDVLPWHEPVDGDRIATTVAAAIKTYAVLSDAQVDVIALWILQTWLVNKFTIAPRLAITSPTKGCGKTTVLSILSKVTRKPKRAGSISPPALFRAVEQFQPTLLLDETEKYIELGGDLHALMNEGHRKGSTVLRVLGEKLELREFNVFGAVAYARNGKIPDDLEQRSIVIEMQRRKPDETLAEFREDKCESLQTIARMCARWADEVYIDDSDPDMNGLINRAADNWRPLFAIADAIAGDWPERIRIAAKEMTPTDADSSATALLADIRQVFDEREGEWRDRIFSEMLAETLAAIEGRGWAEYGKSQKPISKNQLARRLKEFKITPATVKIGTKALKGYYRHQFEDAWLRYLGQGATETLLRNHLTAAGTSSGFQNVTSEAPVADEKCEKSLGHKASYGVTFLNGDKAIREHGCDHCGGPGTDAYPLLEVVDGRGGALLHRACINPWNAGEIPEILDRMGAA